MATIKDVAALAGVSYTTVSHVINKTRPVSDEARAEVEAAIRRLNYLPSAIARSLRHQTTLTIGLLISNNTNPFFSELAHGIEEGCYRNGYSVFLCNSNDEPTRQEAQLRVLLEKRIDGLIVGSAGAPKTLVKRLRASPVPLVAIDRPLPGLAADLVQTDHEEGGYLATKYLIDLGHKTIGCISGPSNTTVSSDRLAGYRRALAEATLPYRQHWVAESDFSTEAGYQAAACLLQRPGLTAVFASNDLMGIGLLRYAAEKGVRVPQELSVIGFDGIELGRYVHPALTTIGQSIRQLGELAANTLIECIGRRGKGPFRQLVLPPEIIVRESSAPPNSSRNLVGRRPASR